MTAETRGRQSRIRRLPADLRDLIDRLLSDGIPQTEIIAELTPLLERRGEKPISPASMSRYASKMEVAARRFRESREIGRLWVREFGGRPNTEAGQAMISLIQTLAFEIARKMSESEAYEPEDLIGALKDLSLLSQRTSSAAASIQKVEADVRKQIAAEAETEARERGITADTAAAIRAAIEGRSEAA